MSDRPSQESGWNADLYDSQHAFVWKYGADLLQLLAPRPGERILDLGCGTGHLTARIAEAGARVLGLDSAPSMIEQARLNYPDLSFEMGDARSFHFHEPFDAVFSNAVLHWIQPPKPVADCVLSALTSGGRFVAEFGGRGNIRALVAAIYAALEAIGISDPERLNPWYYPSVGEYATLLERAGFRVVHTAHFDRMTALEGGDAGLETWLQMFGGSFLAALPSDLHADFVGKVEERVRPALYRDGAWFADYRRLRIVAVKETEA